MTRNKRCALSLRCDGDGELGVASSSTKRESFYGLHEKANTHQGGDMHKPKKYEYFRLVIPLKMQVITRPKGTATDLWP